MVGGGGGWKEGVGVVPHYQAMMASQPDGA